ncbi:MAG: hypothetical protein M0R76_07115 [Proteobacteria bacterium]|jgi:Flp pilus assembly pilin Flp|nr:hypothetical protein [Pseudomonadota bacterium]NLN63142.1 hypothetical protein [Myxococcales bacterium]
MKGKQIIQKLHAIVAALFWGDKRGLSTVEYIIILVLVAVAGIALWQEFGDAVQSRITESTGAIDAM